MARRRRVKKYGTYTSEKNGTARIKKWNDSDKFLRVNGTWPVPVLPILLKKKAPMVLFRNGTDTNRFRTNLFFFFANA